MTENSHFKPPGPIPNNFMISLIFYLLLRLKIPLGPYFIGRQSLEGTSSIVGSFHECRPSTILKIVVMALMTFLTMQVFLLVLSPTDCTIERKW